MNLYRNFKRHSIAVLLLLFPFHVNALAAGGCTTADFKSARVFDTTSQNSVPPISYAVADFDLDGKQDLVISEAPSGNVLLLLNDGAGRFGAPKKINVGSTTQSIATGDFNGDGKFDLAVTNGGANSVAVLLGIGGGQFSPVTNFGVPINSFSIQVADFSADGKLDIAVGSTSGMVSVLIGNGAGSFTPASGSPFQILNTDSLMQITSGDFNSDTKPDLAVATLNGFFVALNTGNGVFSTAFQVFAPAGSGISVGDFNNDTKADLVLGSNALVVLLGNGNGTFSTPHSFPHVSGSGLTTLAVADLDGDAKLDVAATVGSGLGITVFKGDGTGSFTQTHDYVTAHGSSAITLGDFDGDGDKEIVAGDSLFINEGAGSFAGANAVFTLSDVFNNTSAAPFDVALGDFNFDGRSDMAVLHRALFGPDGQASRVSVLLRDIDGNFARSTSIVFNAGSVLHRVLATDLNKDNRADIVITAFTPSGNVVSLNLSNGDGTFAAPININVSGQVGDLTFGDINKDGNVDLIVAAFDQGVIRVLLGNGVGGFAVSEIPSSPAFSAVTLADFNNDTKLDLAATDYASQNVLVMPGNGDGTFGSVTSFGVPGNPLAITSGDFNGDGKADIAATSDSGGSQPTGFMSVMLGNGAGGFAVPVNYDVAEQPVSIVNSDLDGDGKLDLAVANGTSIFSPSKVSVFSGDGQGLFLNPVHFELSGGPGTLVVDDFNADGRKDLAVTLFQSRSVGILLGKPANTLPCLLADDLTVTEANGPTNANVTVHLSAASALQTRVNYQLKNRTAIEGQDFGAASGTLVFEPGETVKNIPIDILGDTINEAQETFTLTLASAVNAKISDGSATIKVLDNDAIPSVSVDDVTVTEGDTPFNPASATFTISLSSPTANTVSLNYAAANGTAIVGEDFDGNQGVLTLGGATMSKTITVSIIGDTTFEPDETFFLNLTNVNNATVADGQGKGTIVNNDPIPAMTISDAFASESSNGDSLMNVTVTLTNPSTQTVTVNYGTADGSATAGSDYVAATGTVTFNPGQVQKNFTITVKDDQIDEANETFNINLSSPTNGTISDGQATATIADNDGPTISIGDVTVTEGDSGFLNATFTLTLSAPSPQDILVRTNSVDGTAFAGVDYGPINTNLFRFIPAGSTFVNFTVRIVGDVAIEGDETFLVNITNPQNCTIGDGQAVATIHDNDVTSAQFALDPVSVNESDGSVSLTVLHVGDLSKPFGVFYSTFPRTASDKSDYSFTAGTIQFAAGEVSKTIKVFITNDTLVEDPETFLVTLSGVNGGATNGPSLMMVTINSDDVGVLPNPIDNSDFFVRQHYRDFLNRDPDPDGLAFWIHEIELCGADLQCREVKRINVSAAFFLSTEFQETGYFVYRTFKAAFGDNTSPNVPGTVPVINFSSFAIDSRRVGQGVQVGVGDWQQQLENNKNSYLLDFVQGAGFILQFPLAMTADNFVDQLNLRAGNVLSTDERAQLIAMLGATPADPNKRAAVLRKVIDDPDLNLKEFERAFVLMQYYGYLRRNPDEAPDFNFSGWKFWLDKLNQFHSNFVDAEMVKAFLISPEYRRRFGNN